MRTKILILFLVGYFSVSFSQQIGDGRAITANNFNVPLLSGFYQTEYQQDGFPGNSIYTWNHLLVLRHSNPANNFQFQLATNYHENDRVFFRKIGVDALSDRNTAWHEFATRGTNTFVGNQNINGEIRVLGSGDEGKPIIIQNNSKTQAGQANLWKIWNLTGSYGNSLQFWAYDVNESGCVNGGLCSSRLTLMDNGNVGIGTSNPQAKLDVAGAIRAREIKVEVNAGADFVFSTDYNLKPLSEIESFIQTNNHLPEIPSEKVMQEEGLNVNEFQIKLLQKIEELTLYVIEQEKAIRVLQQKNENLEQIINK